MYNISVFKYGSDFESIRCMYIIGVCVCVKVAMIYCTSRVVPVTVCSEMSRKNITFRPQKGKKEKTFRTRIARSWHHRPGRVVVGGAWPAVSHHVSVVRPRAELHRTRLLVEREIFDVDLAKRFVDGRRFPHHLARVVQYGLGHYRHLVIAVRAEKSDKRPSYCAGRDTVVRSNTAYGDPSTRYSKTDWKPRAGCKRWEVPARAMSTLAAANLRPTRELPDSLITIRDIAGWITVFRSFPSGEFVRWPSALFRLSGMVLVPFGVYTDLWIYWKGS